MTIELNRRTFMALLGATATTAALARSGRFSAQINSMPSPRPRCFLVDQEIHPPAAPKTAALQYLSE